MSGCAAADVTARSVEKNSRVFQESGSALVASRSSCTLLAFILRDRGGER